MSCNMVKHKDGERSFLYRLVVHICCLHNDSRVTFDLWMKYLDEIQHAETVMDKN